MSLLNEARRYLWTQVLTLGPSAQGLIGLLSQKRVDFELGLYKCKKTQNYPSINILTKAQNSAKEYFDNIGFKFELLNRF